MRRIVIQKHIYREFLTFTECYINNFDYFLVKIIIFIEVYIRNVDLLLYLWLTIINIEDIMATLSSECHKWQPYLLTWWCIYLIPTLIIVSKLNNKCHLRSDDFLKYHIV